MYIRHSSWLKCWLSVEERYSCTNRQKSRGTDNFLFSLFSLGAKTHAVDMTCRLSRDIYSSEYLTTNQSNRLEEKSRSARRSAFTIIEYQVCLYKNQTKPKPLCRVRLQKRKIQPLKLSIQMSAT